MEKSEIGTNIDKLVIILDTNILLYLYKCSFNASQNIVELFSKVKEKVGKGQTTRLSLNPFLVHT